MLTCRNDFYKVEMDLEYGRMEDFEYEKSEEDEKDSLCPFYIGIVIGFALYYFTYLPIHFPQT